MFCGGDVSVRRTVSHCTAECVDRDRRLSSGGLWGQLAPMVRTPVEEKYSRSSAIIGHTTVLRGFRELQSAEHIIRQVPARSPALLPVPETIAGPLWVDAQLAEEAGALYGSRTKLLACEDVVSLGIGRHTGGATSEHWIVGRAMFIT